MNKKEKDHKSPMYTTENSRHIFDKEFLTKKISQANNIYDTLSVIDDSEKKQQSKKIIDKISKPLIFLNKGTDKVKSNKYQKIISEYKKFIDNGIYIKPLAYINICKTQIIKYNKGIIDEIRKYHLTDEQIGEIIYKLPNIFGYSLDRTRGIIDEIRKYGLTDEQIGEIIYKLPSVLSCSLDRTRGIIDEIRKYGLTDMQIGEIIYKLPSVLSCSLDRTRGIINEIRKYGLTDMQIGEIIYKLPSVLSCSLDRTRGIINEIRKYGLTDMQIGEIIYKLPSVLSCSLDRTRGIINEIYIPYSVDIYTYRGLLWFNPQKLKAKLDKIKNKETKIKYIISIHDFVEFIVYGDKKTTNYIDIPDYKRGHIGSVGPSDYLSSDVNTVLSTHGISSEIIQKMQNGDMKSIQEITKIAKNNPKILRALRELL